MSDGLPFDLNGNYRYPAPPDLEGADIVITTNGEDAPAFDPKTGTTQIPLDDGSVTIAFGPPEAPTKDSEFDDNLAEHLSEAELTVISEKLLMGIDQDDQSRSTWMENLSAGISLLGLEVKNPRGGTTAAATPAEGTSTVDSPVLLEAILRFQANARGELLPSDGPIKVRNDGEGNDLAARLAEALEKDLNHYLTKVATEYYPDTDRMLLMLGFSGISFKKGYHDPIKRRPVIISIDANDLIVSNASVTLEDSGRVTHRIMMRPSILRRMQLMGAYRNFDLPLPDLNPILNPVDAKINQIQGIAPPTSIEAGDQDRELYECYCEIEVPGFEHKMDGRETGLPLPYKVTIDKSARRILEIRRNWHEDDTFCLPRNRIIAYKFIPGFGFYGIGLLNVLGNSTKAITAAWRLLIDSGMYANFPGFLYLKTLAKQLTNQFRIPPGGGMPIDTVGNDIRAAVMPLPYKDPSAVFIQLMDAISQAAQRVGGTAELQVGEGNQDAPVGTTLAMIEQATKLMSAVHKRLHQAQGQEFDMLKSLLMEDPTALWRHNKKSKVLEMLVAEAGQTPLTDAEDAAEERHRELFLAALSDTELVPAADPNTSSQTERYLKMSTLRQMATTDEAMDLVAVDKRALAIMGFDDADSLFKPPPPPGAPPPPDPDTMTAQATLIAAQARMQDSNTRMTETQMKARTDAQDAAAKMAQTQTDAQAKAADMASKERIASLGVARELVIHNDSQQQDSANQAQEMADRVAARNHEAMMAHAGNQVGFQQAAMGHQAKLHQTMLGHQANAQAAQQDQYGSLLQGAQQHGHALQMAGLGHTVDMRNAHADRIHGLIQRGMDHRHEAQQNSLDRMTNLFPPEAGVNPNAPAAKKEI